MVYGSGVLLLTAVAGYWVLERAETHKGSLKRVGKVLGWMIIVASLVGAVCRTCTFLTDKGWCPMKGWSCPSMQKSSPPSSP